MKDTQPFIGDLNGDYLEDIIFNDPQTKTLKVLFQRRESADSFAMRDFESSMLLHDNNLFGCKERPGVGVNKKGEKTQSNRVLSVPHSVSTSDFDGDCINDLFLTVTDPQTGLSFYEIYIRKEIEELSSSDTSNPDIVQDPLSGLNSYCLVSVVPIPEGKPPLFHFGDVDRDGMVDMLLLSDAEFALSIFYNKLATSYSDGRVDTSSENWQLCGDTNRILGQNSIYTPLAPQDQEENYVVKQNLADADSIEIAASAGDD